MKEDKEISIPSYNEAEEILVVKVGNKDRPAGPEDIQLIMDALEQARENNSSAIVVHHAISFLVLKRAWLNNMIGVSDVEKVKKVKKEKVKVE